MVADRRRLRDRPGRFRCQILGVLVLVTRGVDLVAQRVEEARVLGGGCCRAQCPVPTGGVVGVSATGADLRVAEDEEFVVTSGVSRGEPLHLGESVLFVADLVGVFGVGLEVGHVRMVEVTLEVGGESGVRGLSRCCVGGEFAVLELAHRRPSNFSPTGALTHPREVARSGVGADLQHRIGDRFASRIRLGGRFRAVLPRVLAWALARILTGALARGRAGPA